MKFHVLPLIIVSISLTHCFGQSDFGRSQEFRDSSTAEFNAYYLDCQPEIPSLVTIQEGETQFWYICEFSNNSKIIKLEFYNQPVFYQEFYFLKNGIIVYAKESETYAPINNYDRVYWNCEYFFEQEILVDMLSLGHGKTEDEDWEPESILIQSKKRLSELEKIKK